MAAIWSAVTIPSLVTARIPVGILAATRLGVVTPQQLRKGRRYALVAIAVMAMLLPGTDPITMLISMAPLVVLFEGSLLLARVLPQPKERSLEEPEAPPAGA